jgi:putative addiction module killer protein
MPEVRQTDRFAHWLAGLRDGKARTRIQARIDRLEIGNPGDVKPVGGGISEMRIDYGLAIAFISSGVGPRSSFCLRGATSVRRTATSRRRASWRVTFRRQ